MTNLERQIIDLTIKAEECKRDAERWRKTLARVGMMADAHGVKYYVRANAVRALDCSVAEHFTAAIDAMPGEQERGG